MAEPKLRQDLHRLVDELVPPAPWLDDQVMQSIPESAPLHTFRARRVTSLGFGIAAAAAVTIGVLLVGVLIGSHLPAGTPARSATQPGPTRDKAVVEYRALIDADMRNIDTVFQKGCDTRASCAKQLEDTRIATEVLLRDTSATAPPKALTPMVLRLRIAAEQFTAQLDDSLYVIAQPNTDYVTASAAPTISSMTSAAAALDCWPAAAVDSGHGLSCS
jgi:hypothetical protein